MTSRSASSLSYAWFVVVLLLVAYVVSFIDRQILVLMVRPVRSDLQLSDTSISVLIGFAFGIFFALVGLPFGRIVDRTHRRNFILFGITLWSLATVGCGLTNSFATLFVARMLVGVGEAVLVPAGYSMIADYFPRHLRARALSTFSMGLFLGSGVAFLCGGWVVAFTSGSAETTLPLLGTLRPWQLSYIVVGLPGFAVALLMLLVREPQRRDPSAQLGAMPLRAVFGYLRQHRRVYVLLVCGLAITGFLNAGFAVWIPTFFDRHFGWPPGRIGVAYGLIQIVAGMAGVITAGQLADRQARTGNTDGMLRVVRVATLLLLPLAPFVGIAADATLALVLLALVVFLLGFVVGLGTPLLYSISPNRMHGQVVSLFQFIIYLISFGAGSTGVALLTDYVFRDDNAVGRSLSVIALLSTTIGLACLIAVNRPYRQLAETAERST